MRDIVNPFGAQDALVFKANGVAGEQIRDDGADMATFFGQAHPHGPAVNFSALMVHVAHVDHFFQVIADIAALIISAGFQLAGRHLVVADIEK